MAIDWNYWLKCRTLTEIEVVLLTLGLDPESYQTDILAGEHYLVNDADLKQKQKDYIKRMGVIEQYRTKSYRYMANDGEWGDYFWANNQKVHVNRFLLWLKNEDMGWDLPKELQAYIEKLEVPNQQHWAQELVDNLNGKLTQPKVTQSGLMKPEEWNRLAEQYAGEILDSNPKSKLEETSHQIAKKFEAQGILSVHGEPIKASTISRCLSDWKFNLKRINANKK
jgi:hypothetical protein